MNGAILLLCGHFGRTHKHQGKKNSLRAEKINFFIAS
jgi:hypothetical protein